MFKNKLSYINVWWESNFDKHLVIIVFENLYVFTCFGFYAICLHLLGNQLHSRVNQNLYTMAFIKVLKFSKTVSKVCKAGVCSTGLEKHDFSLKISICSNNHYKTKKLSCFIRLLILGQRIKETLRLYHWDHWEELSCAIILKHRADQSSVSYDCLEYY